MHSTSVAHRLWFRSPLPRVRRSSPRSAVTIRITPAPNNRTYLSYTRVRRVRLDRILCPMSLAIHCDFSKASYIGSMAKTLRCARIHSCVTSASGGGSWRRPTTCNYQRDSAREDPVRSYQVSSSPVVTPSLGSGSHYLGYGRYTGPTLSTPSFSATKLSAWLPSLTF
ncbi:hypothetical protein BC628DRAFT_428045 [Trametes gibbosa]|nr:hypothetical protein BC628DRAFT_428045 [Trametes gibbosa]